MGAAKSLSVLTKIKNEFWKEPISGSYGETVLPPQQFNILGENCSDTKPQKPQTDQHRAKVKNKRIFQNKP